MDADYKAETFATPLTQIKKQQHQTRANAIANRFEQHMNTQDSRCRTATPSDRLPLLSPYTDKLAMIIPPNMLEEATLKNLVEEFVTRNGTDNGDDSSLQQRVNAVMNQLALKQVVIVYDDVTETANIVPADTVAMA